MWWRRRRRRRDARGGGREEVRRLLRGAPGRHPRQAGRARRSVSSITERIWDYDASLWTDSGEDRWLGWLDVVSRMQLHVDELNAYSEAATEQFHDCVLLGMG